MNLFAPFNSDGYKLGHGSMYAKGTELVYSNLTPRSDRIHKRTATAYYDGKISVVGIQGAIQEVKENWDKFFAMEKGVAIARFKLLTDNYLGRDVVDVESLSKLHDLGYLPLRIKTLDEGTRIKPGIPVLTICNTVPHAFWLVNFLETTISNLTWKPMTTATIAGEYRAMLKDFAIKTGSPLEAVDFQIHDFSARGMSGPEDAARSGFGHIAAGNLGTDSLGSVLYAQEYYGAGDFVAASVPATEHAVATSNILRIERELFHSGDSDLYKFLGLQHQGIYHEMVDAGEPQRLIAEVMFAFELMAKFKTGILSYVMDSFDFWSMIEKGLKYLKPVIEKRQGNGVTPGKLVVRPDTGVPEDVICGTFNPIDLDCTIDEARDWAEDAFYDVIDEQTTHGEYGPDEFEEYFRVEGKIFKGVMEVEWNRYDKQYYYIDGKRMKSFEEVQPTAEQKGALQTLWEQFGGTINEKGYKVLNPSIGLIYGDSITTKRALTILQRMEAMGFASENVVLGVGSFTYQHITRDTLGMAVKATYTQVNGEGIEIYKDPKTDSKKKSARGLLQVVETESGEICLNDGVDEIQEEMSMLVTRFLNGEYQNLTTLDEIRAKLR